MTQASRGSYAWYEEDDSTSPQDEAAATLPALWWRCTWWLATLVFSALWMTESLKSSAPFVGATRANHVTQGLWSLLVTVGCCYGVLQFFKHRSASLGYILCLLLAAAAMAKHKF